MKNNISAVVNCYNEEEYIYYSLKSVYPFVEQIVIVDNCSTDSTRELIKKFIFNEDVEGKVKTHFVKSPMQLADARNFGVQSASCDWVLKWDGDFIAYGVEDTFDKTRSFTEFLDVYQSQEKLFDFFLLYSVNVAGDFYHYDSRREFVGLSGDCFLGRKNCINYISNEKYPDVGILRRPDGSTPRFYRLNTVNNEMYFIHLYGVKSDNYIMYRAFMSQYQRWLAENDIYLEFEQWLIKVEGKDLNSTINYTKKKFVENLRPISFLLPSILKDILNKYSVLYIGSQPSDRVVSFPPKIVPKKIKIENIPRLSNENIYDHMTFDTLINWLGTPGFAYLFNEKFCINEGWMAKEHLMSKMESFFRQEVSLRQLAMVMNAKRLYKKLNSVSPL